MVWVTGGSYQRNACGKMDGCPLAGMNDVIVVVLNFRVNIFGFLNLGAECPGNNGLLDVLLGLRLVFEVDPLRRRGSLLQAYGTLV